MKTITPVLLFFTANFIGYATIIVLYAIAPIYGFVNIETSNFLLNQEVDMSVIMLMWLTCAIFSFYSFFTKNKWKIFFLAAPIIVPLISSITLLSTYN